MQGGFSFCGTDIADLGLEYVPDNANTYVFAGSEYKVHEQSFDAHDGGYFYGATTGVKTFVLRCIFQDSHINDGILTRIENFFYKGRSGRLVFSKRPWVYYVATVTNLNIRSITNYLNGFVTIQMKAYYPYGRSDFTFYPPNVEHEENIIANSSLLPEEFSTTSVVVPEGSTLSQQVKIPLYNGGTKRSAVAVRIAGDVGAGVIIANETTGQKLSLVGLTKNLTSDKGRYLVCDSLSGRTVITDGINTEEANFYHDYGFIELAPNIVYERGVEMTVFPSDNHVALAHDAGSLPDETIGNYVSIDGQWYYATEWLKGLEGNQFRVYPSLEGDRRNRIIPIATMNVITITPVSAMSLTKQDFMYKPTFS